MIIQGSDKRFNHCYYTDIEGLDFARSYNVSYAAAAINTRIYYKNECISDKTAAWYLYQLDIDGMRPDTDIKTTAFGLYIDIGFICFDNIDDFMTAAALFHIKTIIWFGARVPFSVFDYYFLTSDIWQPSNELLRGRGRRGKGIENTFNNMQGARGQRYKYTIWKGYPDSRGRHKVHRFDMVDLANCIQGSITDAVESWNITDGSGELIHVNQDHPDDDIFVMEYMERLTRATYLLARDYSAQIHDITGYDYLRGQFNTAGALAKKTFLKFMYGNINDRMNLREFRNEYPMTCETDDEYRSHYLYRGGICCLNCRYTGKWLYNVYKYDYNSMYPSILRNMKLPYGKGRICHELQDTDDIQIIHITGMTGALRPHMIPVWPSPEDNIVHGEISETKPFYIFYDELKALDTWYDLLYEFDFVVVYKTTNNPGVKRFVDSFFDMKQTATGAKRQAAKIPLNAISGKLAQAVEMDYGHNDINAGGYVNFVIDGKKKNIKNTMSIIIGAYLTALARAKIMDAILSVCHGDPEKNYIYCDTDSIHFFSQDPPPSSMELGELKNEGVNGAPFAVALYLAPKTYMLLDQSYFSGARDEKAYVIHAKGVTNSAVRAEIGKYDDLKNIKEQFRPGHMIKCACAFNVRGGKVTIEKDRYIMRTEYEMMRDDTTGEQGIIFYD